MSEKITRGTLEQVRSGKLKDKTDWDRVRAMTDEDVERAIAGDPDADTMVEDPTEIDVGIIADWTPPPRKAAISIRLDEDVLAFFKAAEGPYQTHINAVLRSCMTSVTRARGARASVKARPARRKSVPKSAAE
ncbi:MAG: BrnA antitoxin family protein [Phreatobacter sp.]